MRPHRLRSVFVTAAVVTAAAVSGTASATAHAHRLDVPHLKGLGRALPSVCGTD